MFLCQELPKERERMRPGVGGCREMEIKEKISPGNCLGQLILP